MADSIHNEGTSSSQASGGKSENSIEINIKTLDSQTYVFQVERNMTVETLKEKVHDVTGIPVGQQRLIFRGRVLKDEHILSEYQLEDGHTLHLVERHPVNVQSAAGMNTQTTTGSDSMQGNGSSLPRNRIGQASRNVLLGTVNLGDQIDGGFADIGRLVGAVVHSLVTPMSNISNAMSNPAAAAAAPAGGAQTASSTSESRNPALAASFAMRNHPIPFIPQVSQFPPAASLSRQTVIPDSLVTLSEFINRMNLAMQNAGIEGPRSSSTNVQEPRRSDALPLNQGGLPTPEMLGSVIDQAQQLLSGNAASTFSHIAARLTREGASTDPIVRGQIQSEVMHAGLVMQHLGAMLLELGRTAMTIRMGDSPAESWVNAGPAVYISSAGPNPIMVQPFPQQTNSIFATSSLSSGLSGTSGTIDPSRNVNIHIHAGTSSTTAMSSHGPNPGETHREHTSAGQASASGNGLGNSAASQGLPSRAGHVISVVLPVQVRSQLSIGGHSGSSQGSLTGGNSFQPTATNPVPNIFTESDSLANLVTSIGARIANELGANTQGQSSSSSSSQSADSFGSHPLCNIEQSNSGDSSLQAHGAGSVANYQDANLSYSSFDDSQSNVREGSEVDTQGSSATGVLMSSSSRNGPPDNESCLGSSLPKAKKDDELQYNSHNGSIHAKSCSTSQEASTSSSPLGTSNSLAEDTVLNKSAVGSSRSSGTRAPASASQPNENERPTPLGLGLGDLQPKRRGKMAKPLEKPEQPHDVSSILQNPHPVALGQHVLQSLLSRGSDVNKTSTNPSECQLSPVNDTANVNQQGGNRTNGQVDMAAMMSHALQSPAMSDLLTGVAQRASVGSPDNLRGILDRCMQNPIVGDVLSNLVQQMEGPPQNIQGVPFASGQGQRGINFSSMIQQMLPVVSQALSGTAQPQQTGHTSERYNGNSISNTFRDKVTNENVGQPSSLRSATEKHSQIPGGSIGSRQQVEDGQNLRDVCLGTMQESANADISSLMQGMMPLISQVLGSGAIIDTRDLPQSSRNGSSTDAHDDLKNKDAEVDFIEIIERIERQDSPRNILHAELESAANLCGEENCCDDFIEELVNNAELLREFEQLLKGNIHQKLKPQSDTKDEP